MDYRLELLDSTTFENLANRICQKILGMGVISFSKGKDGGRDGKFTGSAEKYPSNLSNWSGKFIIQAKHTANPIASCADSEFKKIIDTEIAKIKRLKNQKEVDYYIIFTNRKYSALSGETILQKIIKETGVENAAIIGKESINDLYIDKEIIKEFGLDINHIPFDFSEYEIKNIIGEFKKQLSNISKSLTDEVNRLKYDYDRIKIEQKNKKNKLSKDYFENIILAQSLQEFEKIDSFLSNPINEEIKEQYFDIATELNNLIQVKRTNFAMFEEVFIFIYKKICDGKEIKGKRHIYTILHYMYQECLIGIK